MSLDPIEIVKWTLIAGLVLAFVIKAWPLVRRLVHTVDLIESLPHRLKEQDEKLDLIGERFNEQDALLAEIQHEVTNNDGSSLKDSVDRTEAALAEHLEWAKTDNEQVASRLDRIEAQLAADIDQN